MRIPEVGYSGHVCAEYPTTAMPNNGMSSNCTKCISMLCKLHLLMSIHIPYVINWVFPTLGIP